MSFIPSKIRHFSLFSSLFLAITTSSILITPIPVLAQKYCKIEHNERTLSSYPVTNLEQKIESAMQSAKLKGEVKKIVWAEGLQAYEIKNGESKVFAPIADLFSVESMGNERYILAQEKIGSHYKLDSPAWEFSAQRLVAEEVAMIEGADELDAPWLVVKTDTEGYYVLRIETRGGVLPKTDCEFEGLLGIPYQTIYVIVETDDLQASEQSIFEQ